MWPTANTFRAGHRIRLQVSSGAHPLFCRNAGTGEPLATGRQPALGGPGGLPRRATARRRSPCPVVRLLRDEPLDPRSVGVARSPSTNLPRMTQPTFVPIAEADQVRPARHLHVPGPWTHVPPGRGGGARCDGGAGPSGHPGPDSGFALRLAKRFEHELQLDARASPRTTSSSAPRSSPPSGPPSSGGHRASTTCSSPSTCGASSTTRPPVVAASRRAAFSSISHDYVAQRQLVDSVPEEILRLSPEEARAHALDGAAAA